MEPGDNSNVIKIKKEPTTEPTKPLDVGNLKKIIVKYDPNTGKKYMLKDGKKMEIQIKGPIMNLNNLPSNQLVKIKSISKPPPLIYTVHDNLRKNDSSVSTLVNKTNNVVKQTIQNTTSNKTNKKTVSTSTGGLVNFCHREVITDSLDKKDVQIQTDFSFDSGGAPFDVQFMNFILEGSENEVLEQKRKLIDPNKLSTKEEINKYKFFTDMQKALEFDRGGNL